MYFPTELLKPLIYVTVIIKILKLMNCKDDKKYKQICKELLVFAVEILDDNLAPAFFDLPYVDTLERKFISCLVDYLWNSTK